MSSLSHLSKPNAQLAIVSSAVAVHLIFKRHEMYKPKTVLPLVVGVPLALAVTVYLPHAGGSYFSAALETLPLFWAALFSSILAYRLSPWHPLAKHPGPFLAKFSKAYFALLSLTGKQHIYIKRWHEQYGDIVRIGPNELSICHADAVNPLLGTVGPPKGTFWDGRVPDAQKVKPLIAIRDKKEHSRRRHAWNRAMTSFALKGYEDMVLKRVTQLSDCLAAEGEKGIVDLSKWISYFTYDIMSDLAFGGGSEMMAEGDVQGLWHLLEAGQEINLVMGHLPWLGQLFWSTPGLASSFKAFRLYARDRARIRKAQTSPLKDIFYHLIDEGGIEDKPPTMEEVVGDGALAIIAGSDTTASAIAHLFYYLMLHPVAYKRLQEEIDELGDQLLDCSKHARMPYLNAVTNEALRLLPPLLNGSVRKTQKGSGGTMLGHIFLPEDNSAMIPPYAIQRDARNFSPLPEAFIPERWLAADQRESLEPKLFSNSNDYIHNTTAFIPFSHGPSNCVGKNLAYMEIRLVVCVVLSRLELKLQPGYNPEQWYADMKDFFITTKGVLPTIVTHRKGAPAAAVLETI